MLLNIAEALQKRYGVLQSITEYYRVLRDITGHYGTSQKHCGSLWNVTGVLWSSHRKLQNRYGKYQFCPSL